VRMAFFAVAYILYVLWGSALPAFAIDREAFTFAKYDLDVQVEPAQHRLAVRGKITLRNDSSTAQRSFSLQISSSLDWRSIQVGGKPVQFVTQPYASDIDHTGALSEAVVALPREIAPRGTLELEIGYEGVIVLDTTRLTRIGVPEEKAKHSDWDEIGKTSAAVRGAGYVAWYPVAMESANLSDANSVFETVARWKAREQDSSMKINLCSIGIADSISAGIMNDPRPVVGPASGTSEGVFTTCSVHIYPRMGQTTPLFLGAWRADYSELSRPEFDLLYLSAHKSAADNFVLAADLAAPLVKEWFGAPRQNINVVELNDSEAASFESGNILLTPLAKVDSRLYELTAVHELTHAAFPSPRPWVYEGLAHFAQALDREQHNDRQGALDFMALFRATIGDAEKPANAGRNRSAPDQSLIHTGIEEFYRSKAMFVWWMLRDMIGSDALKKALASYQPEQDNDPAYIQHLLAAQSKRNLQWFFDDWVYADRGLPDFHVESAHARAGVGGGYFVSVTIENLGNAGAEVPVVLRAETGEVTRRLEVRAKSKTSIRIDIPSKPEQIVINDGSVPESDISNNTFKISPPDP
jgi:hypothetical protein